MRILVIGGDGGLGRPLAGRLAAAGHEVIATTRRPDGANAGRLRFDLADAEAPLSLPEADACVLAAGVTMLRACEEDPAGTGAINVDGVLRLARTLAARGTFVLLLSTSQVFDGGRPRRRIDEPPSPLTAYGRQKAAAERGVLELGHRGSVLRLTKVIDPSLALLRGWTSELRAGRAINAFVDLVLAPVTTTHACEVVERILAGGGGGIHHASGDEDVPYLTLAHALADQLGAPRELVRSGSAAEAGLPPGFRPRHTSLDPSTLEALGLTAPASRDAIAKTIAAIAL